VKAPARPDARPDSGGEALQRIDRWLWFARIAKSRTLAQVLIERGKVRINRLKIDKTSTVVRPGDVLTLSLGPRVISIEILAIGARRGPAIEAQALYRDLAPRQPLPGPAGPHEMARDPVPVQAARTDGSGRPTKRERRELDKFRGRS
jgi:ribosome-associated heat shock protein Hsp15